MNEWLNGLVAWAETLKLHETMQNVEWMVPAFQTVHILAIAIVFSSSLVVALRAVQRLRHRLVAGALGAKAERLDLDRPRRAVAVRIGADRRRAGALAAHWVFQVKMVLVVTAVVVALVLTYRLKHLNPPERTTIVERLLAVLLVLLWMGVISAGRWIAYS